MTQEKSNTYSNDNDAKLSIETIRAFLKIPDSGSPYVARIINDEVSRSDRERPPEVSILAVRQFMDSFLDPSMSQDDRAAQWEGLDTLGKIGEREIGEALFKSLPEAEQKPIIMRWVSRIAEQRAAEGRDLPLPTNPFDRKRELACRARAALSGSPIAAASSCKLQPS